MKTKITHSFEYNGLGFTTKAIPKRKQQTVEIIGVMKPVDPGFVTVKTESGEWKQMPTLALAKCPSVDFSAMLTDSQIKARQTAGFLFGTGVNEPRHLVELKYCPLLKTK